MGKYRIGKILGEGASAKVYIASNIRTGETVAIKAITKKRLHDKKKQSLLKTEASAMRSLRHPNIIQLYEVLYSDTEIYFVMEYAQGGDLYHKLADLDKPLPDDNTARRYFQQLISALAFCHSRGIYHRDIKPENMLLDENGNLKVADFGVSAMEENVGTDGLFHTRTGTRLYSAPEVLEGLGYDGAKADIWSCGVILYVLRSGTFPFQGKLEVLLRKMYKKEYNCPSDIFSEEIAALLSRMLDPNPGTRITIPEIMEDPWFKVGFYYNNDILWEKSTELLSKKLTGCDSFGSICLDISPKISSQRQISEQGYKSDFCTDDFVSALSTEPNSFKLMVSVNCLSENLGETGSKRVLRFTSKQPVSAILAKFEEIGKSRGFNVRKEKFKVYLEGPIVGSKGLFGLGIEAEIFEVASSLNGVDVRQTGGDSREYEKFLEEHLRPALHDIVWNWQDNINEE